MTGDLVWVNGPFLPGIYNDLMIFRGDLMKELGPRERVEADKGYLGEAPDHVKTHYIYESSSKSQMRQGALTRHETVNNEFKRWACLQNRFRHVDYLLAKHGQCVHAISVIIQLTFELHRGVRPYQVNYNDVNHHET
jgi:hypothetical protein